VVCTGAYAKSQPHSPPGVALIQPLRASGAEFKTEQLGPRRSAHWRGKLKPVAIQSPRAGGAPSYFQMENQFGASDSTIM
jgi:hypothetical protein